MPYIDKYKSVLDKSNVLLRASLNVPLKDGKVLNDFRIRRALPSIKYIAKRVRRLVIIAHIGKDEKSSLYPVYQELKKHIKNLQFIEKDKYFNDLPEEGIFLLENLRSFKEEKEGDLNFAKKLAKHGDIFVQDAFAVMHREHASIVGIPKFLPSYFGLSVKNELKHLKQALNPGRNSAFVLGGAKFATKEPLIKKMLDIYDKVLIAGALANEALAARGFSVGASKIEDGKIDEEVLNHPHLILPEKYTVEYKGGIRKSDGKDIKDNEIIVDAFPPLSFLSGIEFLLWNGPLGWYEKGYTQGTASLINQIEIYRPKTIVGGGDSNALIEELGKEELFEFRSSGGGAMLYYLEKETLPGIEAIEKAQNKA